MNRLDLNHMFSLRAGVINQSLVGNIYKPYINYIWSPVTTALDGTAESKNKGTSGVNLKHYSGNPLDFQGSQYIEVNKDYTDNPIVWSVSFSSKNIQNTSYILQGNFAYRVIWVSAGDLKFFDGVNHTLAPYQKGAYTLKSDGTSISTYLDGTLVNTITPNDCTLRGVGYIGSPDGLPDGQLDYLIYNKAIPTQEQITKQYTNPNQFYKDMVDDVNTLFATDFRGNDGYISDDVNRSVGGELTTNGDVATNDLTGWTLTVGTPMNVTVQNNSITILPTSANGAQLVNYYSGLTVGSHVVCEVIVSNFVSSGRLYYRDDSGYGKRIDVTSNGTYRWIDIVGSLDNQRTLAYSDGATEFTVESMSAKPISGVCPITNYSPTMRTNFQTEQSGMQDLMIERDSLGFFLGLRDYPKGNGVGYADTGERFDSSNPFTLEIDFFSFNGDGVQSIGVRDTSSPNSNLNVYMYSIGSVSFMIGNVQYNYAVGTVDRTLLKFRLVYELNTYRMYIGNALISNGNVTYSTLMYDFSLLARNFNGDIRDYYKDEIQKFKVHNKALTDEEIQAL